MVAVVNILSDQLETLIEAVRIRKQITAYSLTL